MKVRRPLLVGAVFLLGMNGCSIETLDQSIDAPSENVCSDSSDCSGGASCVAGTCQAPSGELDTVLLSVTPPGGATYGGVRFLTTQGGLAAGPVGLGVALDQPPLLTGYVAEEGKNSGCASTATFRPTQVVLGLPAKTYAATTAANGTFDVQLPVGSYDIYLQPGTEGTPGDECPELVPHLYRAVDIQANNEELPLPVHAASELEVHITIDDSEQLAGWTADLLDPVSGLPLSTPVVLGDEYLEAGAYEFVLRHSLVFNDPGAPMGQELLRLTPPSDSVAPTLVWKRDGLELFAPGKIALDLSSFVSRSVNYEGFVYSPAFEPVAATVLFTAIELNDVSVGNQAAYRVDSEADGDGKFSVPLLPGAYRVRVEPAPSSGFGAAEDEVLVSEQGGGGASIVLDERSVLAGNVVFGGGDGSAVVGAQVIASATPFKGEVDAFRRALGEVPFTPQATAGLTDPDGTFKLEADRGTFDLSVRPAPETGLPWLVRPNVVVPNEGLGRLSLAAPIVYPGQVTIGGAAVQGALVRAYAYVGEDGYQSSPEGALSVIAVGEAFTNEDGTFSLFLASSLN